MNVNILQLLEAYLQEYYYKHMATLKYIKKRFLALNSLTIESYYEYILFILLEEQSTISYNTHIQY